MSNFYLSQPTYDLLTRKLAERPGSSSAGGSGAGTRQVLWVRVDGIADAFSSAFSDAFGMGTSEPTYSGTTTAYRPDTDSWIDYGTVEVVEANGRTLTIGNRYLGIRHATDVFVVWSDATGFFARITGDDGYGFLFSWVRVQADGFGTWGDTADVGTLNATPFPGWDGFGLSGRTIATGTYVWMIPSQTPNAFEFMPLVDRVGWFAEITDVDSSLTFYSWLGIETDGVGGWTANGMTGTLNASPVRFVGGTYPVTIGSHVWMVPSLTDGRYEFTPFQAADVGTPGLVSAVDQSWSGIKTFEGDDGTSRVIVYPSDPGAFNPGEAGITIGSYVSGDLSLYMNSGQAVIATTADTDLLLTSDGGSPPRVILDETVIFSAMRMTLQDGVDGVNNAAGDLFYGGICTAVASQFTARQNIFPAPYGAGSVIWYNGTDWVTLELPRSFGVIPDGDYRMVCSVTSGVPSFAWELVPTPLQSTTLGFNSPNTGDTATISLDRGEVVGYTLAP